MIFFLPPVPAISLLFFAMLLAMPGMAFEERSESNSKYSGESYTLYIENDARRIGGPGSDSSYSNGVRFSYVYTEKDIPFWAPLLTNWSDTLSTEFDKSYTNFGASLAHQIFTPQNTASTDLILNDRPYAAWLYFGMTSSFQTTSHSHSLEFDVGVVGPSAMGEDVQNNFHSMIGVPKSNGWAHQLEDEPTLQLSYQQRLRFYELKQNDSKILDFIPYFGGAFGNVLIGGNIGMLGRIGFNIPDDYGPTRPSSSDGDPTFIPRSNKARQHFGAYLYGGLRGNAIAHNIFLDGSIFQKSHHVSKYPFTAESEFGLGAHLDGWSFVWRFVSKSPEFKERSQLNSFASISLSYSQSFE